MSKTVGEVSFNLGLSAGVIVIKYLLYTSGRFDVMRFISLYLVFGVIFASLISLKDCMPTVVRKMTSFVGD